jgi:hypothetical protein
VLPFCAGVGAPEAASKTSDDADSRAVRRSCRNKTQCMERFLTP